MNRLVLIDGNAVMHRAYHALPPLTAPDGTLVNIVYGFVSVIIRLFQDLQPTHLAVAFDRPGPTFRNELYKEYQVQRPKMEDDFIGQISIVHDVVAAFGIPIFEMDGFEADDMIGSIAHQITHATKKAGIDQVVIVTGDRDILQLVEDEKVLVFMPTKGLSEGKLYGEKDVVERMGVLPKLIIDLKALMGDSSDNYPGVAGIGPKTATQLLATYGSVRSLYDNIDTVAGITTKTKLIAGKDSAFLGIDLATIRTDAPIVFDPAAASISTLRIPAALSLLDELHFPSLIARLTGNEKQPSTKQRPTKQPKRAPGSGSGNQDATDQQTLF